MTTSLLPFLFSFLSLIFGHDEATLVFAGDAMMHQAQINAARQPDGTYDYTECFAAVKPYVMTADYAVVNLETPVSAPPYAGYPCFNAPESYIDALANAGFDMFLTANNHTLDRQDRGLRATLDALDRRGLDHTGSYRDKAERDSVVPNIRIIGGIKIGFINYTYGTNGITPRGNVIVDYIDRENIRRDVKATRDAGAEVIVACMHWGDEHRLLPNENQRSLAKFLHELDVDIIVGGHPHVIQPVELTTRPDGRRQLTIWSLGNFISNMLRQNNRGGMIMSVTLRRMDDGSVIIADASYRLVFTETARNGHNFRLRWVDDSDFPQAAGFAATARRIFAEHNIGVTEDTTTIAVPHYSAE